MHFLEGGRREVGPSTICMQRHLRLQAIPGEEEGVGKEKNNWWDFYWHPSIAFSGKNMFLFL